MILDEEIRRFIECNVVNQFYTKKSERLFELKLDEILHRKNVYLFKAKNLICHTDLIIDIMDAYLSSQEETFFGQLLEDLAIFVNKRIYNGRKAEQKKFKCVDLIFEKDKRLYIVEIKSGPYWGNSTQLKKLQENFVIAKNILKAEGEVREIIAINGCIYGNDNKYVENSDNPDLNYYKKCGQEFWEFITGDENFYKDLIKPIEQTAKKEVDDLQKLRIQKIHQFSREFLDRFCSDDLIDWDKLIEFVSKRK